MNIKPSMKVIDYLRLYGRMPVLRITPVTRTQADKPATHSDTMNAKRAANWSDKWQGVKPNHL